MGSRIYRWRLRSRPRDRRRVHDLLLAKVRGGGGKQHTRTVPVLCTMDDAMAALSGTTLRAVAQACVDYNNAKTEAELRDESAQPYLTVRAFKSHAPPSFTSHKQL